MRKLTIELTLSTLLIFTTLVLCNVDPKDEHAWQKPGCHIVAIKRTVQIPGCVAFDVTTNACLGYCESFAIPSPYRTMKTNRRHIITSRAECCNIIETHDVKVTVICQHGLKDVIFKSAKTCDCSVCRRG